MAFCLPRLGSTYFSWIERTFGRLARRKNLSVLVVGFTAFLLRLTILPLSPIPHPFSPNDFSFLLAADTFSSGRLTNTTPVMWVHLETMHVTMTPTYMSMYFPAQGLILAAGKVLTDMLGLAFWRRPRLCAPPSSGCCRCGPSWALLGGVLAILRLGLFSYWIDSYSGAGSIAALGGALLLERFHDL